MRLIPIRKRYRRIVKENYGFEKLYSQGSALETYTLDVNYQIQALKSLRKGIEDYDKRHGCRADKVTNFLIKIGSQK